MELVPSSIYMYKNITDYSTLLYLAFPAVEGTEVAAALASAAAADVAAVGGSVAAVVVAGQAAECKDGVTFYWVILRKQMCYLLRGHQLSILGHVNIV